MDTQESQVQKDSIFAEYEKYYADYYKKEDKMEPPIKKTSLEEYLQKRQEKGLSPLDIQEYLQLQQKENQQLIVQGGYVEHGKEHLGVLIRENIPIYLYVILCIFGIAMIFIAILQSHEGMFIGDYWINALNKDVYIYIWLGFATYILFLVSRLLFAIIENRSFYIRPANHKSPLLLGIGNAIGFTLVGNYREVGDTVVAYHYFTIIVPLIPLGCYRVKRGKTTRHIGRGYTTPYIIYGSERWNWLEVVHIIIKGIIGLFITIAAISIFGAIFD